ncbi:uncharacterized protein LOC135846622 [Planococcus citri]|uniref:uncharacterized protein LOC135846622 n=1 Tax=Planococcus citri TaxID=170843 RepID=UPI0031F96A08
MDSREAHNSDGQSDSFSGKFQYRARLPSLQEMASYQIAIAVWYGYFSSQQRYKHYSDKLTDKLELNDCHKLIKTLARPRFMEEALKKHMKQIRNETIHCVTHFRHKLFSTYLVEYQIPQLDLNRIVWFPDGRINYKSTAFKMLRSSTLTQVQKFAIMSHFCLENEIKTIDLNRSPMKSFVEKVHGNHDPLLLYWIYYLKKELHKIPPFFTRSSDSVRINSMYSYKHRWETFEYFWDRLSAGDQLSFISSRLPALEVYCWKHRPFYKMSYDQQCDLVCGQPAIMIIVFFKVMDMPEWALKAWNMTKSVVTNKQFVWVLSELLNKYDKNQITYLQEEKMSVLLEIWDTATDEHKHFAAEQRALEETIAQQILSQNSLRTHFALDDLACWKQVAPSGFKFLLKYLSLKSAEFRKDAILNRCDCKFIINFDFDVVGEIFDLCLPNLQDKVEFKTQRGRSILGYYFCKILYSKEDHDELNRRLLRSFQNLNIGSNYVNEFIQSSITNNVVKEDEVQTHHHNTYEWLKLSKFINKILQENISTVLEMKRSYISSFDNHCDPYERYGSLDELSQLIEQEYVHENLKYLKLKLIEKLRQSKAEQWVWLILRYEKFSAVFSWGFENNEEMVLQLKQAVPIDDIIIKVLKTIARQSNSIYHPTPPYNNLEKFLEWYFSDVAEEVASFKLGIMNNPEAAKILESIEKDDQQVYGELLQWIGNPNFLHSEKNRRDSKSSIMNMFQNIQHFYLDK